MTLSSAFNRSTRRFPGCSSICVAGILGFGTPGLADLLVTGVATNLAIYDGGPTNIAPAVLSDPNYSLGHTFNVEFTPVAEDLTGTVTLIEIGGTSRGAGIYLIDGVPTYLTKHNSADHYTADSLFDTTVRPTSSTHGEAAVTNSFGVLTANTAYSVAVSWDQAGKLLFGVKEGSTGVVDEITLTGFFDNWVGDRSFSVGLNPRLANPVQSCGGLAGEVAGNNYPPPWDVAGDGGSPMHLKSFAGILQRALYWNAAGGVTLSNAPTEPVGPQPSRFFVTSLAEDYVLSEGTPATAISFTSDPIRVGGNTTAPEGGRNSIFIFPLPRLGSLGNILSVEAAFTVRNTMGAPAFHGDLWALGIQPDTVPLIEYCQEDWDAGDPTNIKIHDNLLVAPIADGTVLTTTNPPLTELVKDFYNANPDYAGGHYLFLRLNPDSAPGSANNAWNVAAGNGGAPPILTIYVQNTHAPEVSTRPNFVLIISDDQRYDAMGMVQREQGAAARFPWFSNGTPSLDRMASEGVRFRNAFVVQSVCSPSRAAMLTGQYNHINGIQNNFTRFPIDGVTFASLLREQGYRTGIIGKYHMTGQMVDRPGFDDAISFTGLGNYTDVTFYHNGIGRKNTTWIDDESTSHALNFLELNRTNHFALVLGFKSPHGPFVPPARNAALYAGETAVPAPSLNSYAPYRSTPATAAPETILDYFRCVTSLDENVGRVLDKLDELNLSTNTVVVFISDNGFLMDEHGLTLTKWAAYEPSIRTALLIRYPQLIAAARTNDDFVLNMDLMPTLLELAGISIPAQVQGCSLVPILAGNTPADWRKDFLYENFRDNPPNPNPILFAVRNDAHKLIIYPGHPEWTEMFNFLADPYETNNLYSNPAYASLASDLNSRLHQLLDETGLRARLQASPPSPASLQLSVRGGIGPIYRLLSSADLDNWEPLQEFKMTGLETSLTVTNPAAQREFYRLKMLSD